MEQSREEFEKWLKSELPTTWRLAYGDIDDEDDELVNSAKASILDMMTAWQASREAVVVTLPTVYPVDDGMLCAKMYKSNEVVQAIEAQGLTVK